MLIYFSFLALTVTLELLVARLLGFQVPGSEMAGVLYHNWVQLRPARAGLNNVNGLMRRVTLEVGQNIAERSPVPSQQSP